MSPIRHAPRDSTAGREFDPCAFDTQGEGRGLGIDPLALIHVDEVDARGLHTHQHFIGAGCAEFNVSDLLHLGSSGCGDLEGARHQWYLCNSHEIGSFFVVSTVNSIHPLSALLSPSVTTWVSSSALPLT